MILDAVLESDMRRRAREINEQAENIKEIILYMDIMFNTLKHEPESNMMIEYEDVYNKIKPSLIMTYEFLNEIADEFRQVVKICEEHKGFSETERFHLNNAKIEY